MTDIVYGAQPVKHTDELRVEQDHKGSQSVKYEYQEGKSKKEQKTQNIYLGLCKNLKEIQGTTVCVCLFLVLVIEAYVKHLSWEYTKCAQSI